MSIIASAGNFAHARSQTATAPVHQ